MPSCDSQASVANLALCPPLFHAFTVLLAHLVALSVDMRRYPAARNIHGNRLCENVSLKQHCVCVRTSPLGPGVCVLRVHAVIRRHACIIHTAHTHTHTTKHIYIAIMPVCGVVLVTDLRDPSGGRLLLFCLVAEFFNESSRQVNKFHWWTSWKLRMSATCLR